VTVRTQTPQGRPLRIDGVAVDEYTVKVRAPVEEPKRLVLDVV
jgi:hypothetical protein